MQFVDHIFILLIFVVLPIYSAIDTRLYLARIEAGQPANRVRFYVETSIMQWVFLAAVGVDVSESSNCQSEKTVPFEESCAQTESRLQIPLT